MRDGLIKPFPVRLYAADTAGDDEMFAAWYEHMPEERRKRCDRFVNAADRRRSIAAYALLFCAVSELLEDDMFGPGNPGIITDNGIMNIAHEPDGKPYFTDLPVFFNISHSEERVAVAVSCKKVGCDVEIKCQNALKIAERFFTDSEYRYIASLSDDDTVDSAFKKIWTLKESAIKCCGDGMKRDLADFCVVGQNGMTMKKIRIPEHEEVFYLNGYDDENGYCYSVCSAFGSFEEKIRFKECIVSMKCPDVTHGFSVM